MRVEKYIYEPVREKFRIDYALIFATKQHQLIIISSQFKCLPSAGYGLKGKQSTYLNFQNGNMHSRWAQLGSQIVST